MSDPNREALDELVYGLGLALMEAGPNVLCATDHVMIRCPAGLVEFAKVLEARYLLVPRDEIVGTAYGVRGVQGPDDRDVFESKDRAGALADAVEVQKMQAEQGRAQVAEPVERFVLAYQAIPLPDVDGVDSE